MNVSALFAFVHHVGAFTLAGALIAELVLFDRNLNLRQAKKLQRADLTYGISAGVVLAAGLLRVFSFGKGGAYYFHNVFFIAKVSLFAVVALLSIYPTVFFVSWNKRLKAGIRPPLEEARFRRCVRSFSWSYWESLEYFSVLRSWPAESACSNNPRMKDH